MLADKDVHGMLELLEPVVDEVVVTQNSSTRAVPADELAALAVDVFGADRVTVEPRLDDAIETAVRLAEDTGDDLLSGAGVLVTGSVVTAGEARVLLGAGDDRAGATRARERPADDRTSWPSARRRGPTARPAARWPRCSVSRRS